MLAFTVVGAGMDHRHFLYEPDSRRSTIEWPRGLRIAFWVVVFLEYYELYPPDGSLLDSRYRGEFGNFAPDYRAHSLREYGNRVGIFRILELLQKYRLRATVAANSMALVERRPLALNCVQAGHEIAAHGIAATRLVSSQLSANDEVRLIDAAREAVVRVTGQQPRGWISQDFGESHRTPELLAAAGFDWVGNWPNDDSPYFMTTSPPLISIPYQNDWDDANVMEVRKQPAWKWQEYAIQAFDLLKSERGRVYVLGLHPWIIGHPHCIAYLDRVLEHVMAAEGVWQATGSEIAAAYAAQERPTTNQARR